MKYFIKIFYLSIKIDFYLLPIFSIKIVNLSIKIDF